MNYLAIDIGNVIVDMDFTNFLKELSVALNISKDEAYYFLERSQQLHDLGLTLIKSELKDHFKIRSEATIDKIMNEWANTLTPNKTVISWLEGLIDKGVKIALLSNMGHEHYSIMRTLLGEKLYDNSVRYFSCNVGARKPSLIFYHTFLSLYPDYRGSVYLDDNGDNIGVGNQFGFRAIQFDLFKINPTEVAGKVNEIEKEILKQ